MVLLGSDSLVFLNTPGSNDLITTPIHRKTSQPVPAAAFFILVFNWRTVMIWRAPSAR